MFMPISCRGGRSRWLLRNDSRSRAMNRPSIAVRRGQAVGSLSVRIHVGGCAMYRPAGSAAEILVAGLAGLADLAGGRLDTCAVERRRDRKSTRLNSSHVKISYAVF